MKRPDRRRSARAQARTTRGDVGASKRQRSAGQPRSKRATVRFVPREPGRDTERAREIASLMLFVAEEIDDRDRRQERADAGSPFSGFSTDRAWLRYVVLSAQGVAPGDKGVDARMALVRELQVGVEVLGELKRDGVPLVESHVTELTLRVLDRYAQLYPNAARKIEKDRVRRRHLECAIRCAGGSRFEGKGFWQHLADSARGVLGASTPESWRAEWKRWRLKPPDALRRKG